MGIGFLRIEEADLAKSTFTITVSEDLDCSGLPELDYEVCTYDERFIAALLEGCIGSDGDQIADRTYRRVSGDQGD